MLDTVKDVMYSVGCSTSDLARRVGDGTVDIAKRVGPKRGIIGFIAIGAAVGGSIYLIRYLRARRAEMETSERSSPIEKRERRARETARSLQH